MSVRWLHGFCALLCTVGLGVSAASAAPILFLVAELPVSVFHGDSYVIGLEDPADVDHARDLIALGLAAGAPIVVARIAAGADGQNRDILAPGAPAWSWHLTEILGFADVTIEILDGWPSFVEQDVAGWIRNTGGLIGFWSYTITRELGPVPEPSTALMLGAGLVALALGRSRKVRPSLIP